MNIGVFGLIGTGKSTICKYLAKKYNLHYFSSDQIAKNCLENNLKIRSKIKEIFPDVFDGSNISSIKLTKLLFNNPEQNKIWRNKIWPLINQVITKQINECHAKNNYFIFESVNFSNNYFDFDKTILLQCDHIKLIERVRERKNNKLSTNNIKNIIKIQKYYFKNSNFKYDELIDTSLPLEDIYSSIDKLIEKTKLV